MGLELQVVVSCHFDTIWILGPLQEHPVLRAAEPSLQLLSILKCGCDCVCPGALNTQLPPLLSCSLPSTHCSVPDTGVLLSQPTAVSHTQHTREYT